MGMGRRCGEGLWNLRKEEEEKRTESIGGLTSTAVLLCTVQFVMVSDVELSVYTPPP